MNLSMGTLMPDIGTVNAMPLPGLLSFSSDVSSAISSGFLKLGIRQTTTALSIVPKPSKSMISEPDVPWARHEIRKRQCLS
ncbi:MAG: hypothetical protein LBJ10_10380 [Clostridiales bacterium]|nr:hypothetical protein [Clostridiales bacterium]